MTVPLALDLATLPTALTGAGPALIKRLTLLDAEQVPNLHIYAPDPAQEVEAAAGPRLIPVIQKTGLAELLWALLAAVGLFVA